MRKNVEEENKVLEMKENEIINKLMGTYEVPKTTIVLERLGIPVELKGLTRKEMDRIKKECTRKRKISGRTEEKLDNAEYDAGIVVGSTTNLDWNNPKLLESANVSDGKQFIMRKLLAGEISALASKVLDLSGFGDELEEAEDIKNSSAEEVE